MYRCCLCRQTENPGTALGWGTKSLFSPSGKVLSGVRVAALPSAKPVGGILQERRRFTEDLSGQGNRKADFVGLFWESVFQFWKTPVPPLAKKWSQGCQRPGHGAHPCREHMEMPRADVPRICTLSSPLPRPHWHSPEHSNFPHPGSPNVPEVLKYSWNPPAATQVCNPAAAPGPALSLKADSSGD